MRSKSTKSLKDDKSIMWCTEVVRCNLFTWVPRLDDHVGCSFFNEPRPVNGNYKTRPLFFSKCMMFSGFLFQWIFLGLNQESSLGHMTSTTVVWSFPWCDCFVWRAGMKISRAPSQNSYRVESTEHEWVSTTWHETGNELGQNAFSGLVSRMNIFRLWEQTGNLCSRQFGFRPH